MVTTSLFQYTSHVGCPELATKLQICALPLGSDDVFTRWKIKNGQPSKSKIMEPQYDSTLYKKGDKK